MHPLIKSFIDSASFNCMLTVSQELYPRLGQRRRAPGGSVRVCCVGARPAAILRAQSARAGQRHGSGRRMRQDASWCVGSARPKPPSPLGPPTRLADAQRHSVSEQTQEVAPRPPPPQTPEPEAEAMGATQGQIYPRSVWFGANVEASYILQPC